jgi:hemerythrin-like domain-containing protein
MKPRGLLMIEHRLIEKVLIAAKNKASKMSDEAYDPIFIDTVVDFIRTYADRTHHGKEEDILFKKLEGKELAADDRRVMGELIMEHKQARQKVKEISDLNAEYRKGKASAVPEIVKVINWLSEFYPVHIIKEDKVFFVNTEKYFNEKELENLLKEFYEFDQKMIHEKYLKVYREII